ncbi:MAG: ATP-binding cassette domain-containing protein [Acidobacteriota bacterium]
MELALSLDGVTKRFGSFTAVDHVSLEIPSGTIYGFLGQNGAGKTTTIRMIMSILYPDEGSVRVLGGTAESRKDRLGYLPEEKGLYKKMTTTEILTYFGRLKGLDRSTAKRKAKTLLEEFGLGEWVDQKCEALSKGMGQKVQVLGTLIHDPELVILDEPFSGLDPVNVETMRDLILRMKREGRTVIFSTHVMEQAEQLCDSIFLIHRGRKVIDGPLSEVKATGDHGVQVDYDGDGSIFDRLPGVERVNNAGKHAELFLDDSTNPQAILRQLVDAGLTIRRFDLREPSLHEVFVRTVGADPSEPSPEPEEVSR